MKKLIAIGEALIDFAPDSTGRAIKDVESFAPHIGGAPANVCGAYVKLGGKATLLTKLGQDPFGDKIESELKQEGIDVSYIIRTKEANTSLAFVALMDDGDREFSFYRKPGADMLYQAEEVPQKIFEDAYALHFCSVSLGEYPMRDAHRKAIEYAKANNVIVSFDPNLRKQLWDDEGALQKAVRDFIPYADIVKMSEEEVEFVTGYSDVEKAVSSLIDIGISVVLVTYGSKGAKAFTKAGNAKVAGIAAKAVDTTGAGDGFMGSFLYQLSKSEITKKELKDLDNEALTSYIMYSNVFCSQSIKKMGAIASYIDSDEMEALLK